MIKALILDKDYSKNVILKYGIHLKRIDIISFLNNLCLKHSADYKLKTLHYEDLENDKEKELFLKINNYNDLSLKDFNFLWELDDIVDGIDLF